METLMQITPLIFWAVIIIGGIFLLARYIKNEGFLIIGVLAVVKLPWKYFDVYKKTYNGFNNYKNLH